MKIIKLNKMVLVLLLSLFGPTQVLAMPQVQILIGRSLSPLGAAHLSGYSSADSFWRRRQKKLAWTLGWLRKSCSDLATSPLSCYLA